MGHSEKITVPTLEARRAKKMRNRRLKAQDLKLGSMVVRFHHAELAAGEALVEDLSQHGMALVVAGGAVPGSMVLAGDRLDEVRVSCQSGVIYRGNAVVRRVAERSPDLVIGVELEGAGLDLAQLYRSSTRQDFARRWESVKVDADFAHLSPAFKAFVADLRAELSSVSRFLESEDEALAGEDRATREVARREFLSVVVPDLLARLDHARGLLHQLVNDLSPDDHAEHRAYCALQLNPFLKQSPFLRRALDKPLGYAGDYEMMNMLYRDPAEGETLFGQALNMCFTSEPAALANKNRISYLGSLIRETILRHPGKRVRIASLGCGPAREIEALLTSSPELGQFLDVALIDQEERAIAHCERTLQPLATRTGARIQYIRESLRTLLTKDSLSEKLGRRELIYSAGLFDYLDDRMFSRILCVLAEALTSDGMLAVGNVAAHNPSRWVMEYFSEWFLIHRSPEDLRALARPIHPAPHRIDIASEPSGVNLFLILQR